VGIDDDRLEGPTVLEDLTVLEDRMALEDELKHLPNPAWQPVPQ
jgi:hypothetical protein